MPPMLKKPKPADFEFSKNGVWHRPTKERFISHPGKPADGVWKDGHSIATTEYDIDAVRQMGRTLWAMHIAQLQRNR